MVLVEIVSYGVRIVFVLFWLKERERMGIGGWVGLYWRYEKVYKVFKGVVGGRFGFFRFKDRKR